MTTEDLLQDAHLRFSTDSKPGFTRKIDGKNFSYFDLDGKKITDEKVIDRINKLAIPPAYDKVWICPYANGHMQATGYDSRKRKQYRYHPLWNRISQEEKFSHLIEFAQQLPTIREKVQKDIALTGMPRQKVIAAVVWLLENTLIRIGNEEYEKENKSYGLTTLKNRHAAVFGKNITFQFKGKSGVYHKVRFKNKRLANIIRQCKEIPGQDLFEYIDEAGAAQTVSSQDINDYLKEITNADITAKDFRTWGATLLAASEFCKCPIVKDESESKKNIIETIKQVSSYLRNKPNTCKKYYIHPYVIAAYMKGYVLNNIKDVIKTTASKLIEGLDRQENNVLLLLKYMARFDRNDDKNIIYTSG